MSHYTVAVFVKDLRDVDSMMEPYNENLEVEPYIRYTAKEVFEYFRKENNISTKPEEDNSLLGEYNEIIISPTMEESKQTIIEWAKDWYGVEDYMIDDEGNIYSTYNSESKWDWYEIGGRWNHFIRTKNGESVNSAKIKDIDFFGELVDEQTIQHIREDWNKVMQGDSFYRPEYYIERYKDVDGFIKDSITFSTYAVLDEIGWHEPGKMGWFGTSAASPEDQSKWTENFYKNFIANADPETWIVIVDCHI